MSEKLQEGDLELIELLKVNHWEVRAVYNWSPDNKFQCRQTGFGSAMFKEKTHKSGK